MGHTASHLLPEERAGCGARTTDMKRIFSLWLQPQPLSTHYFTREQGLLPNHIITFHLSVTSLHLPGLVHQVPSR